MKIDVRLCPSGRPTTDTTAEFLRVPCIGEYVYAREADYRVVDVHWYPDGPVVVAHSLDRPRAQAPFA